MKLQPHMYRGHASELVTFPSASSTDTEMGESLSGKTMEASRTAAPFSHLLPVQSTETPGHLLQC